MNYEDYIDSLIEIPSKIDINKITILTGRNAGGKSLVRKLLKSEITNQLGKSKVFIPHASQALRTNSNPEMGGLSGATHDLDWLATSKNTIDTIDMVFRYDNADYIVIDEPEIGIGDELLLGLIDYLNIKIAESNKGVLIITHSKTTVKGLIHDNFANLEGLTEEEWLNRTPQKLSIEDYTEFADGLFRAIRDRMNKNKNKK